MSVNTYDKILKKLVRVAGSSGNITVMTGTDGSDDGEEGLVPAPHAGDEDKFLRGDGNWATPEGGGGSGDAGLNVIDGAINVTYDDGE